MYSEHKYKGEMRYRSDDRGELRKRECKIVGVGVGGKGNAWRREERRESERGEGEGEGEGRAEGG